MTFAACAHAVEDETLASDRSALQPRTLSPTNARAEFRDPTVERRYMHAKPQLRLHTCLTAIVALVLTALVARTAYVASIGASADAWLAPFTGAVLTLAFASVLLALVATRCTGRTLPCAFSEAACPALVCATLVLVPLALARRDMHGGHADDALDACALASQRATISSVYLNRVLLALALLAVCSPVRPRCFEVVMLCASFGGVWLHFVAGRALPAWMHAVDLAAFFAVELLLLRACHLLAHSRRAESRLSGVAAAAEEWRVRTELETEQRQQQEQATQEARSRLVRMVMHDLRSPLLTISNSVEMLTDQIQLTQQPRAAHARPPEGGGGASGGGAASAAGDRQAETEAHAEPLAWECLRSVRVCTQLMEDIMSDMLDFERISSGRLLLVWAPFQVEQLLGAAQCTFAGLCEAKGVRLVCGAVPRALEGRWFRADLRRLQQCLNNGLSNAVRASRPPAAAGRPRGRARALVSRARQRPAQPPPAARRRRPRAAAHARALARPPARAHADAPRGARPRPPRRPPALRALRSSLQTAAAPLASTRTRRRGRGREPLVRMRMAGARRRPALATRRACLWSWWCGTAGSG